ncbi:MAG: hypothetical protein ACTS73_07985 [Arsenophonus sp. NEOnobi-MAG3]
MKLSLKPCFDKHTGRYLLDRRVIYAISHNGYFSQLTIQTAINDIEIKVHKVRRSQWE